ncbi:hypothetical protein XarjCFBP7652_14790 [Xanthomonas arboricola]|nr:hypothetical protein XarjCFBP7652_14790 [Xanthomonas arboricola]
MRQRPWGNDASAYRTPCSPCPVRHTQCDTRMTDYAALKLTEMFVGVACLPQCGTACAATISWSRWRSLRDPRFLYSASGAALAYRRCLDNATSPDPL